MTASLAHLAVKALAGAATWSIAEHVIHNLAGHKYAKNGNLFAQEHVRHHRTTSYFAPSIKKVGAAAAVTAVMGPIASAIAGRRAGLAYTAGFVAMYGSYEWLHRRAHTHAPKTRYGRWLRKHHFHHHFHKPNHNHGVTSPIFDHLFGTYDPPSVVRVPERHAMPWLVDPATGEVHAEFADDYVIARKKKKGRPLDPPPAVQEAEPRASSPVSPVAAA